MVEVHRVEQALDDRVAIGELAGAERGVNGGPAGADQHIRRSYRGLAVEGGASDVGVGLQERSRQGEGVVRDAERGVWRLGIRLDDRHRRDLVALLGGGADAGEALEELEDGLRQALVGDDRGTAGGHVRREVERHGDVFDVERTIVGLQVVPVGVRVDADFPVTVLVLNEVKGVVVHFVGWVGHEVAVPLDGRRVQDVVLGGLSGVETSEDLFRFVFGRTQFVRGSLFEATEQVSDRLVLLRDAGHGDGPRDDADLVRGVALVLGLPQGVLAEPDLEVAIDGGDPRHGFYVLVVQRNPPCGVARGDCRLESGRVRRE